MLATKNTCDLVTAKSEGPMYVLSRIKIEKCVLYVSVGLPRLKLRRKKRADHEIYNTARVIPSPHWDIALFDFSIN